MVHPSHRDEIGAERVARPARIRADSAVAEEALPDSEAKFRTLAETSSTLISLFEGDQVTYVNPAMQAAFGITEADVPTLRIEGSLIAPTERKEARATIDALQRGEITGPVRFERAIVRGDGRQRWLEMTFAMVDHRGRRLMVGSGWDITDVKRAETELLQSRKGLRNLTAKLQSAREEERLSVAREVHDIIGQPLVALKMQLSALNARLSGEQQPLREQTAGMIAVVEEAIEAVRNLAEDLRGGLFEDLPLTMMIEMEVVELSKRNQIPAHVLDMPVDEPMLTSQQRVVTLRILQEALTNIVAHAQASNVTVRLRITDDVLVLDVSDDGVSITRDQLVASTSLGVIGMQERARALGGQVAVEGRDQGGTVVTLTLPLTPDNRSR